MNHEPHQYLETVSQIDDQETPIFRSDALFGAHQQIRIAHDGAIYLLRITRSGKLILTK